MTDVRSQIEALMQQMKPDQPEIVREFGTIVDETLMPLIPRLEALQVRAIPASTIATQLQQVTNLIRQLGPWAAAVEQQLVRELGVQPEA